MTTREVANMLKFQNNAAAATGKTGCPASKCEKLRRRVKLRLLRLEPSKVWCLSGLIHRDTEVCVLCIELKASTFVQKVSGK